MIALAAVWVVLLILVVVAVYLGATILLGKCLNSNGKRYPRP